uniref:Teneurin-3 n=1 Tax=Oryzias sinensis TaxID=183150 RepID=A0A8C7Y2L7_9TELE
MERVREQRPFCSLSKSQRERERDCGRDKDRERRYTASSTDRDGGACRVPTQKSYSSSETLQAFDHDPSRMLFGGRVKEMAHMESSEYARAGQTFSLRQLGICDPPPRRGLALGPEAGLSHPLSSYSRGPAATENHEPVSPERTMTLWGTGAKSGQNSCLSSRSNSALTLTDTEMDNKSDTEMECLTQTSPRAGAHSPNTAAAHVHLRPRGPCPFPHAPRATTSGHRGRVQPLNCPHGSGELKKEAVGDLWNMN